MGGRVSCESFDAQKAFPELAKVVPLTPKMSEQMGCTDVYQWGCDNLPQSQTDGCRTYHEVQDALNHKAPAAPFPTDARAFHAKAPAEDRINTQYEHIVNDSMALEGPPAPKFQNRWQRELAYYHGAYVPETHQSVKTADDVRIAVSEFEDKVHQDGPNDSCKYLQIEEFRCLQVYQFETRPREAGTKCAKWFDEWQKCQWDQEKFNQGYTHVEGPQLMKKRRSYIFYPDFNYA